MREKDSTIPPDETIEPSELIQAEKDVEDRLYEEFYDPSQDYLDEPRSFCYELATQLICQAKEQDTINWYDDINTIEPVAKLLILSLR